ncbi:hypothetical protein B566_EDAN005000 [Ephemera danica]|nr:hypothetical protein B566_EDAN005000 [Ephemera danica]
MFLGNLLAYYTPGSTMTLEEATWNAIAVAALSLIAVIFVHPYIFGLMHLGMKVRVACCSLMYPRKSAQFRFKTAKRTDERVRLMNEIISGIQVIKMYAWEHAFTKLVAFARKIEIQVIRMSTYIRGINLSFMMITTRIAIYMSMVAYVLMGNQITAEKVFVMTSYYGIIRHSMTIMFPQAITQLSELIVTVKRIQTFLLLEEVSKDVISYQGPRANMGPLITRTSRRNSLEQPRNDALPRNTMILNANNFSHDFRGPGVSIQNATAHWSRETGDPTLNDVTITLRSGELVVVIGTVGAGKTSLIQAVLGELPLITGSRKVKACALERDLSLMPNGDLTLVGERGVTLSGGQRARVSLARAVYKEAHIYLLDDPLSAVDAHVARHLVEECITGLLRTKCGRVEMEGSYEELQNELGLHLSELLSDEGDEEVLFARNNSSIRIREIVRQISTKPEVEEKAKVSETAAQPVAETRTLGSVSGRVYAQYLKSTGSYCRVVVMLSFFLLAQLAGNGTDFWESRNPVPANANKSDVYTLTDPTSEDTSLSLSTQTCIIVHTTLILILVIATLSRSFMFTNTAMSASSQLHDSMFRAIFLSLCGVTIVVAIINYWMLIPTLVIVILFYFIRRVYLSTSRSVKRMEGVTKSPIYTHISASLQGLATIRAFEAQPILETQFDNHVDFNSSAWYLFISISRSFGYWLDMICSGYIALVTLGFLGMGKDTLGGNVGLAITQSMMLTGMFQWGMRQSAEVENNMTSVERVMEFCDLESEPPLEMESEKNLPQNWPANGEIVFEAVSLSYPPIDELVLKEVSFVIRPREKIGIVGRTGAGKSSLMTALFRLVQYQNGRVLIDNVDTSTIGLHKLRANISIIPQEPVLFSGTFRKNLDPFDEYTDAVLWKALEEVELKDVVTELPQGLESRMSEGGGNLSVGQRQLVCLARAVLRNNRILVLDEATANVDLKTDGLIQNTIRSKFAHCTVLTIAHRLNTIMDSNRVLLMDAGKVLEFDSPIKLLRNPNSLFARMARQQNSGISI